MSALELPPSRRHAFASFFVILFAGALLASALLVPHGAPQRQAEKPMRGSDFVDVLDEITTHGGVAHSSLGGVAWEVPHGRAHMFRVNPSDRVGEHSERNQVYLEDGRYAVTDDEGKYHFEGLTPGSHVVQLDPITLPAELEPLRCDNRVRSAGNALSQFVDMRGGALGTADFVVGHRAAPTGEVRFGLTTQLGDDRFEHSTSVTASAVPLTEAEVVSVIQP